MLLMVPKQWTAAASGGSSCKHHQGSNKGSSSTNRLKSALIFPHNIRRTNADFSKHSRYKNTVCKSLHAGFRST